MATTAKATKKVTKEVPPVADLTAKAPPKSKMVPTEGQKPNPDAWERFIWQPGDLVKIDPKTGKELPPEEQPFSKENQKKGGKPPAVADLSGGKPITRKPVSGK